MRGGQEEVAVHTGGIDGYWGYMKHFIPSNLTNVKRKLLLLYVRSFQWRCLHKSRDVLFKATGLYLKKLRR